MTEQQQLNMHRAEVMSKHSLLYQYAIAEGNSFQFLFWGRDINTIHRSHTSSTSPHIDEEDKRVHRCKGEVMRGTRFGRLIVGLLSIGTTIGIINWKLNKQDKSPSSTNSGSTKKIAVIGAGVSGIVTTKWLVEAGHQVKTFEQAGGIGGNWYYIPLEDGNDTTHELSSSCYQNLRSITTSNSMSFEGFPIPKKYGVFPRHSHIHK